MRSSRISLLFGALFAFTLLLSIVCAHAGHGHDIPQPDAQRPIQIDELDDDEDFASAASPSTAETTTSKPVELPTFTVLSHLN
jgi:hypothetical protein